MQKGRPGKLFSAGAELCQQRFYFFTALAFALVLFAAGAEMAEHNTEQSDRQNDQQDLYEFFHFHYLRFILSVILPNLRSKINV